MEQGYKVVHVSNDNVLRSAVVIYGSVDYKVGEFVFPLILNGPLCVFGDVCNAINYVSDHINFKVYECEYEPSDDISVWRELTDSKVTHTPLAGLYENTILAKSVKLVKELEHITILIPE